MEKIQKEFFEPNDLVPNSKFPVLIYRKVLQFEGLAEIQAKEIVSNKVVSNGWYLDWVYSVYPFLHYHSTAFECLVVYSGKTRIQLGGKQGKIFEVESGDCVVIPPGVGHERMLSKGEKQEEFVVFGIYPKGQTWDFISENVSTGGEEAKDLKDASIRKEAEENIAKLETPKLDPMNGTNILDIH